MARTDRYVLRDERLAALERVRNAIFGDGRLVGTDVEVVLLHVRLLERALKSWDGPSDPPCPNRDDDETTESIARRRIEWWVSNWDRDTSNETLAQTVKACVYGLLKRAGLWTHQWGR